ncbi:hypothetical protein C8F01DRAFT_1139671 [Mycena amicta]|nr:hypothetical protein C8F01DRAFT_1139671 [Mycena amicta]
MSKFGGPALDDNDNEIVEQPSKRKMGLPKSDKWNLTDLPDGTQTKFTTEVVPLLRELVGTRPAWDGASIKDVQVIVDRVFPGKKYMVVEKGPWYGPVGYRLSNWRNGFAAKAKEAVDSFMCPNEAQDDDAGEDDAAPTSDPAPDDALADPTISPEEDKNNDIAFDFKTKEGRRQFVEFALQKHMKNGRETGTQAYQWKVWGNGEKREGVLMSYPILYTFSYHHALVEEIPSKYDDELYGPAAIGAIILSAQAVQRELQFWATGDYHEPTTATERKAAAFSADNWGDQIVTENGVTMHRRRAGKFIKALQAWPRDKWAPIYEEASSYVEPKAKKAASSAASESEGTVAEESDADITSD